MGRAAGKFLDVTRSGSSVSSFSRTSAAWNFHKGIVTILKLLEKDPT